MDGLPVGPHSLLDLLPNVARAPYSINRRDQAKSDQKIRTGRNSIRSALFPSFSPKNLPPHPGGLTSRDGRELLENAQTASALWANVDGPNHQFYLKNSQKTRETAIRNTRIGQTLWL
jgi:hypothetical protein